MRFSPWPTLLLALSLPVRAEEPPKEMNGLPLLFSEDFASGTSRWEFTDPKVWHVAEQDGNKILEQTAQSDYKPPFRSPLNIAFIKDLTVGDFVLEFRVQSTGKDVPHRDICVIWGYQDPSHFYYAHIARDADPVAHNIHVVDAADRKPITKTRNEGVKWNDQWHVIRVVRKGKTMEVFYDGGEKPVLTAEDGRFGPGRIGLGSFDDTGRFDDVRLWGAKVEKK